MWGTGIDMRLSGVKVSLLLLCLCGTSMGWSADYLYAPQPVTGVTGEGVLVREVTIQKGDTLSALSKHYSGRGYYYPQILLFSEIKNPHRIYPGQVIRVPLSHKTAGQQEKSSTQKVELLEPRSAAVVTEAPIQTGEKKKPAARPVTRGEKNAYKHAVAVFKKGDCTTAIKLFDAFISRYPASAFLPEAALSRAECYLKLSSQ